MNIRTLLQKGSKKLWILSMDNTITQDKMMRLENNFIILFTFYVVKVIYNI